MVAGSVYDGWTTSGPSAAQMHWRGGWILAGLFLLTLVSVLAVRKALTAFLTLRALALTPTLSRYLSRWVKSHDYSDDGFMRADGAEERWVQLRKHAISRLADVF